MSASPANDAQSKASGMLTHKQIEALIKPKRSTDAESVAMALWKRLLQQLPEDQSILARLIEDKVRFPTTLFMHKRVDRLGCIVFASHSHA